MNVIAERSLVLVENGTGQRRPVTVRLGQPYWIEEGIEAACPVLIEGMLSGASDIYGMDLLDAVECAVRFVNSYLKDSSEGSLCWPSGESYESEGE
ncbi:DUF6968 family protein [Thauera sinica]|uniref:DUF6968 family protein n=1 Tax=Thauera sinica TaxID=2665146 RepID=A0ABW1AVH0_9RHOO